MLTASLVLTIWASLSPESLADAAIVATRLYIMAAIYGAAFLAIFIPAWLCAVLLAIILGVAA